MANAKLHIICGNCGCSDMWGFKIDPKGQDFGDRFEPEVFISCGNCATIHPLSDYGGIGG